ncbi:hydrogenase iron-sulfur subunit [bacterium]|nr:hydrogenase iron-sulfur subunit [bacterium]
MREVSGWRPVADTEPARKPALARALSQLLWPWEKLNSWLFGANYNPTYQSGVLAVFLLGIVVVTGVPLLLFYRVGAPYESMQLMQNQFFLCWLRALHRYASDAAVLAVLFHTLRMLLGGRTAGPRARAWLSGIAMTALMVAVGVLGLMMVWDEQAQRLAIGAIQFLEGLPLFSEPPRRVFGDNSSVGEAFFFMLIFLHVALPLVLTFLLIFHTSRTARARLWPEPHLVKFYGVCMAILALLWPAKLAAKADLLHIPGAVPLDWFYAFWLPLVEIVGPTWSILVLGLVVVGLASIPWWWSGRGSITEQASVVDESHCTGCTQCFQDCPYDAIQMVPRTQSADERHSEWVARVNSDLCVSCGICAGSCAPMGVGPPMRTGRDQMRDVDHFASSIHWNAGDVVVLACRWGTGESKEWTDFPGLHLYPTGCSGSLHTSILEMLLRKGASGVLVVSCPERDCSNREGPKWLRLRVYEDREAELQARVDRGRVRLLACPAVDIQQAVAAALAFREELLQLGEAMLGESESVRCRTQEVKVVGL